MHQQRKKPDGNVTQTPAWCPEGNSAILSEEASSTTTADQDRDLAVEAEPYLAQMEQLLAEQPGLSSPGCIISATNTHTWYPMLAASGSSRELRRSLCPVSHERRTLPCGVWHQHYNHTHQVRCAVQNTTEESARLDGNWHTACCSDRHASKNAG